VIAYRGTELCRLHAAMTNTETYELASRFLSGYGLADCPLAHCAKRLTTFDGGYEAPFRLRETTLDAARALQHLSLLSWPDSRHVLFPVGDSCCALINNSRNGSDYGDYVCRLAIHLGTRCARVVNRPGRVWSNGTDREVLQWEAHIFCLNDANGEVIRSVDCVDDGGRWDFSEFGDRHPVESAFPYSARRKRDRFTAEHLETLIAAFGFPNVGPTSFLQAGRYMLSISPAVRRQHAPLQKRTIRRTATTGAAWVTYRTWPRTPRVSSPTLSAAFASTRPTSRLCDQLSMKHIV
jgi:hypothetical protein